MSGFTPQSFHSVKGALTTQDQVETLEPLVSTANQAASVTDGAEQAEHFRVAQTAQSQIASIRGDGSWLPAPMQRLVARNLGVTAHVEDNYRPHIAHAVKMRQTEAAPVPVCPGLR